MIERQRLQWPERGEKAQCQRVYEVKNAENIPGDRQGHAAGATRRKIERDGDGEETDEHIADTGRQREPGTAP